MRLTKEQQALDEVKRQFTYQTPSPEQIDRMGSIRLIARDLAETIVSNVRPGADRSAALRKLREAVMTANAGIALEEPKPVPVPDGFGGSGENAPQAPGRIGGY